MFNLFKPSSRYKAQRFSSARVDFESPHFRVTPLVHEASKQVALTGRHYKVEQKQNGEWVPLKRLQRFSVDIGANDIVIVKLEIAEYGSGCDAP